MPDLAEDPSIKVFQTKVLKKGLKNCNVPEMPEGEIRETCVEHIANSKKKLLKNSNKNFAHIKALIQLPFTMVA